MEGHKEKGRVKHIIQWAVGWRKGESGIKWRISWRKGGSGIQ